MRLLLRFQRVRDLAKYLGRRSLRHLDSRFGDFFGGIKTAWAILPYVGQIVRCASKQDMIDWGAAKLGCM